MLNCVREQIIAIPTAVGYHCIPRHLRVRVRTEAGTVREMRPASPGLPLDAAVPELDHSPSSPQLSALTFCSSDNV
jgi:hypothetical protein